MSLSRAISRVVTWDRLDCPGQETCRFTDLGIGWRISGEASYAEPDQEAELSYVVETDAGWRSLRAQVSGTVEGELFAIDMAREIGGDWQVDGSPLPGTAQIEDIDLGFTPATNTPAIRRLSLAPGARSDGTALWLDMTTGRMKPLRQGYLRLSGTRYRYLSPENDYQADLDTDAFGVVTLYPGLWQTTAP